jgi:leucyl aminopeptidase
MRHFLRPRNAALILFAGLTFCDVHPKVVAQDVKEQAIGTPLGVAVKVRMEGPYTAETPLQVVCYFHYTADRAKRMAGAPVELDKELGGVIAKLRERGEFEGAELETLLLITPKGSIKAKALLLIGLGEESSLSLERMERVGRVALRGASLLGARRVAFAPLIRDQGNTKLGTGAVEEAVVRGMLLAYDTHRRLQQERLASDWTLDGWNVEAGPAYFAETVAGVTRGVAEATATAAARTSAPYMRKK